MDLTGTSLEDVILPRLEYAGNLCLHALARIEQGAHGVDQVVKLFQLLHQLLLWQELDPLFDVALLCRTLIVCHIDILHEGLEVEHASDVTVHQTRDALNLVTQVGQDFFVGDTARR